MKKKGSPTKAGKEKPVARRSKSKETDIDPLAYEKWHRENHSHDEHNKWIESGKPVNPEDFEEAPVQISKKERRRREDEKASLLSELKGKRTEPWGHEEIQGQKVDYLDQEGFRVYGKSPLFNTGCLIRNSDSKWSVTYNFERVGIEIPTSQINSQLNTTKKRHGRYWLGRVESLVFGHGNSDFLAEACNSRFSDDINSIARALKSLWAIKNRPTENESVILSIAATARLKQRIPFKGEVRSLHGENRPKSEREPEGYRGRHYEAGEWNQILKKIGFDWLPAGKRGANRI